MAMSLGELLARRRSKLAAVGIGSSAATHWQPPDNRPEREYRTRQCRIGLRLPSKSQLAVKRLYDKMVAKNAENKPSKDR